ncbi:restriction endonuclease, partial [Klebsiella aerogenes]
SEERLLVWLSIVNSFAFDWMLRRVLTTTVNYFLLQSVPIPRLTKDDLSWKKLANAARELNILDNSGATRATHERMAQLRAQIDTEVALAYGLGLKDMELILQDFPLLDRGQIRLHGESRSTITRDTVLSVMASRTGNNPKVWSSR